jgi:hypothetical protein
VVIGEDDATARLNDSPGARAVRFVDAAGALAGRVAVADGAAAYANARGLLVDGGEALTLWDPQGTRVWSVAKARGGRWVAMGGYMFVRGGQATAVIAADSGAEVGRDPFGALPLAVLPATPDGPGLAVLRAGFVWARALP